MFNLTKNNIFLPIKLLIFFVCFLFTWSITSSTAQAQDLSASLTVKDTFTYGDKIYFDFKIIAAESGHITYVPYVNCPDDVQAPLELMQADIKANEPFTGSYTYKTVTEDTQPQKCTAMITVSPGEKTVKKEFSIDTKKTIDFTIDLYEDSTQAKKTKGFTLDSKPYATISSALKSLTVSATLTYPDNMAKTIVLPASLTLNQAGTYTLTAVASKINYQETTKTTQFYATGEQPTIQNEKIVCNNNNICEPELNETVSNCAQDCVLKEKITERSPVETSSNTLEPQEEKNNPDLKILFGLALLLIILALCIVYFRKRK